MYFTSKDTNTLVPEARNIDVKELTKEPYQVLINLLMEGPKNEKLEKNIPEGTKINKIEKKGNTICIDVSKEFIENQKNDVKVQSQAIYSIVNTMTQLNEIEAVKIIVDGEENSSFPNNGISLKDAFVPKEETT